MESRVGMKIFCSQSEKNQNIFLPSLLCFLKTNKQAKHFPKIRCQLSVLAPPGMWDTTVQDSLPCGFTKTLGVRSSSSFGIILCALKNLYIPHYGWLYNHGLQSIPQFCGQRHPPSPGQPMDGGITGLVLHVRWGMSAGNKLPDVLKSDSVLTWPDDTGHEKTNKQTNHLSQQTLKTLCSQ